MKHAERLSNSMYDDRDWRASWLSDARAGCLPILLLLAVTLLAVLLVACAPGAPATPQDTQPWPLGCSDAVLYRVRRLYDEEADVVCWVTIGTYGYPSGISCLPRSETALPER